MSFLRPLTINFSVHSRKFLLLRTGRSACWVSLYLSLWHLPWNISPQNKNRWIYILSHQPEQNMKCPRSPLIAFCFSKLGHLNISNNRAIAHNVKGERERPSGKVFVTFRVCKKHCSNVQSSRYLIPPSLSQPLNEWSNRSPACCRKSPKCFFPMQTTFTAALNLHKLSHCPAQQQCNTVQ